MATTLADLQAEAVAFRDERNWGPFHTPKDLMLGLVSEVGELSDELLWKSSAELETLRDVTAQIPLRDELADVLIYLLYLAEHFGVDLAQAVREKIVKNAIKYPVETARR